MREEAAGERFIGRTDGIVWLCPFAPQGQKEVWAVFENRSDYREVSDEDLSTLSRGVLVGPALLAGHRQQRLQPRDLLHRGGRRLLPDARADGRADAVRAVRP